jgi:YD repeat-containing protein
MLTYTLTRLHAYTLTRLHAYTATRFGGTAYRCTYNTFGQVLTHTDGKGQTTRLERTSRGLPSSWQNARGHWFARSTTRRRA